MYSRHHLKQIQEKIQQIPKFVWVEYGEQYLKSMRDWISEETYTDWVAVGGRWSKERNEEEKGHDKVFSDHVKEALERYSTD